MKETYNIQVLERAIKIIEVLEKYPLGISLRELADEVDLNKTTVFRILATLENYNYIIQDQNSGVYKLGYKFLELSNSVMQRLDIREIAHPYLEELSTITGEVVHLVILDGDMGLYIDKVDKSSGPFRMISSIGKHAYLHSSAVGKVLIAYMDKEQALRIIEKKGLPKFTENTITTKERLMDELVNIRNNGYAVDEIENENGIRCVAAPIFNFNGEVIAAISIAGFTFRITKERLPELIYIIKEYSNKISREFGFKI